jgi:hypothetical protein
MLKAEFSKTTVMIVFEHKLVYIFRVPWYCESKIPIFSQNFAILTSILGDFCLFRRNRDQYECMKISRGQRCDCFFCLKSAFVLKTKAKILFFCLHSGNWGRCYDHNFLRKNGVFLKNQCYDQILAYLALF